ncbi:amidohydrolase family protein, partial [Thermoflexus sp.]|uniref:amidohydrolase family protein n=1 Tax=Thermoflexus sp. TaxID=1969742 RepID=UPI002ADD487E
MPLTRKHRIYSWVRVERRSDQASFFIQEDFPPDGRLDQSGQRKTFVGTPRPHSSRFFLYYAPGWDLNPYFVYELRDGLRIALGKERTRWTYPLANLRGVPVAFRSDRPVVDGAPLKGIQAAVLRCTQSGAPFALEEALTVEEALRAYTFSAAYAAFAESELGALAPGRWADLVVLGEDP